MKIPRDYRQLAKKARAAGWKVTTTRGGHLAWISPAGRTVYGPSTPSDRRSLRNVAGKLRRAGLKLR